MKKIKNFIAPVKLFIAVIFSTVLALATLLLCIPAGYLFDIGNCGGLAMYVTIQIIYLIATLNYLFDFQTEIIRFINIIKSIIRYIKSDHGRS